MHLFTRRRGYDWSARYPSIISTAAKLRAASFTIDGEAVVCGPDGIAVFDALHRRGTISEAMPYAFDPSSSMARTFAPYRWATARSGW